MYQYITTNKREVNKMIKEKIEWIAGFGSNGNYIRGYINENKVVDICGIEQYTCKELFEKANEKYPNVNNYRQFCSQYKLQMIEYNNYMDRDEKRYNKFWKK
jgi:hypothetical protein